MAISTRSLDQLPEVDELRCLLQSLAMLDAILSPDWQYRYYSFNSRWSEGEQMGSMRDGCGDDLFALFNAAGCFLKGFAHESAVSVDEFDNVPVEFADCLKEPAFNIDDTTFCIWRRYSDTSWQHGAIELPADTDADGSQSLLSALDGNPASYKVWAEDYYERPVPLAAIQQVYAQKPLTEQLVQMLNPKVVLADLAPDIAEIGYPEK